jgi:methyl-accepting chemotaxis protein
MPNPFYVKHVKTLILSAVLIIACLLVAIIAVYSEAKATEQRLLEQPFNLSLVNLSQNIDARISSMKLIAKTVANDKHIHDWVENGFSATQESILIDKLGFLVKEYGLTSASFADKNTHKYWNHEGFLRVLQPETDIWYFAYLKGGESDLVSVYHDKNKNRVDVYVNYQQTDGNGLSGIATSFNGVLDMLKNSLFAKHGDIYLVDSLGKIQVQSDAKLAGEVADEVEADNSLQDMFSNDIVDRLLKPDSTGFIEVNEAGNRLLGASYIPSMNWYVVANVMTVNE